VANKKHGLLTELELCLMKIVWQKGRASVQDVRDALPKGRSLAYTTVLTMMRILERKGFLRHEKQDRSYVYEPVVQRLQATRSMVRDLVNRLFDGSPELLLVNVLENESIDREELARLRQLIGEKEAELT